MTEDRDFKRLVRQRAAKTGESYQAARRQLERRRPRAFAARVEAAFPTPAGTAFGCVVEEGRVDRGMPVTVTARGTVHRATVASLRRSLWDVDSVAAGDYADGRFGLIVEPPYDGPLPARVTAT